MAAEQLLCTPLEGLHEKLGASFTNFAGWRMPVRYTSDLAEHRAVRTSAGLFDLSHMGEVRVAGPQAGEALDHALAGKLSSVSMGRAKYSLLLTERGTVADDLVTYHVADDEYVVIPNAANVTTDLAAITERCSGFDVTVTDESTSTALIALQGPASAEILLRTLGRADTSLAPDEVRDLRYYRVLTGTWQGAAIMVARTGYTGEDGFELYVPNAQAEALWTSLQNAGGEGVVPCGLACRDTLRLEAGMPLYGHELTTQTFPSQAGLGRVVSFKKESDFVGRSALEARDGPVTACLSVWQVRDAVPPGRGTPSRTPQAPRWASSPPGSSPPLLATPSPWPTSRRVRQRLTPSSMQTCGASCCP